MAYYNNTVLLQSKEGYRYDVLSISIQATKYRKTLPYFPISKTRVIPPPPEYISKPHFFLLLLLHLEHRALVLSTLLLLLPRLSKKPQDWGQQWSANR